MLPSIAIPGSWLVGPDGTLLMEQVGFGFEGEEWQQGAEHNAGSWRGEVRAQPNRVVA